MVLHRDFARARRFVAEPFFISSAIASPLRLHGDVSRAVLSVWYLDAVSESVSFTTCKILLGPPIPADILPNMIDIILFEDHFARSLAPLTDWRTVGELRLARYTMFERATKNLPSPITGLWTRPEMADVAAQRFDLPINQSISAPTLLINARLIATMPIKPNELPPTATSNESLVHHFCNDDSQDPPSPEQLLSAGETARWLARQRPQQMPVTLIQYPWDLVRHLAETLNTDCARGTSDRERHAGVHPSAELVNASAITIELTAGVAPLAVLDATAGPIFIDEQAVISPHALIEGPAYIGPNSKVNPHAHLHGGVAIGPHCKVGGEIDACIFHSYSNKQHAGFLGHAYVGSWVNLGAGTTNSDLKNTYGWVKAAHDGRDRDTGMQFFGATIADHVKTGIGQTIPTGACLGFAAMIATSSMAPKDVPPAAWLTPDIQTSGDPDRLLATARKMASRRSVAFSPAEESLLQRLCRR